MGAMSLSLAVAQKMDSQIRGMTVAARNASDGILLRPNRRQRPRTVSEQLQRMRELATQYKKKSI